MNDQARPEAVVARLRPHARALAAPIVLGIALAGLVPFLGPRLDHGWPQGLLYAGAGVLGIAGVVIPVSAWLGRSYTITTRRVVVRRGVLVRVRKELLHRRGTDVTLRAAGLQAIFGSGDISIDAGGGTPVVLHDVPKAVLVQSALVELMDTSWNPVAEWRRSHDTGELV